MRIQGSHNRHDALSTFAVTQMAFGCRTECMIFATGLNKIMIAIVGEHKINYLNTSCALCDTLC
jgi:predicted benzoate:H+ symporter BenE